MFPRCGRGFFERQVQAVSFGGEKPSGGGARFLLAVGGDNNQTLGVFDLGAAAAERRGSEAGDGALVDAPLLCQAGMDKLPGALPTVFGLAWRSAGGEVAFASLSQGKSLKWWEADKAEATGEVGPLRLPTCFARLLLQAVSAVFDWLALAGARSVRGGALVHLYLSTACACW